MRVNGNAVSAQAGARGEFHKAKGLCGSSLDHFPHIHTQFLTHDGHFIGQADIDGPECIFQEFNHFRRFRIRYSYHFTDNSPVQCCAMLGALIGNAPQYFGCVGCPKLLISRVDPFRGKTQPEIFSRTEPLDFQLWQNKLPGGARIGSTFQDNQHIRVDKSSQLGHDIVDIRNVRVLLFVQGRGYTNGDSIQAGNHGEIGRSL